MFGLASQEVSVPTEEVNSWTMQVMTSTAFTICICLCVAFYRLHKVRLRLEERVQFIYGEVDIMEEEIKNLQSLLIQPKRATASSGTGTWPSALTPAPEVTPDEVQSAVERLEEVMRETGHQ